MVDLETIEFVTIGVYFRENIVKISKLKSTIETCSMR